MILLSRSNFGRNKRYVLKDKQKSKNVKRTFLKLWSYIGKEKRIMVVVLFSSVFSTLLNLMGPYFISIAVDDYILAGNMKQLWKIVIFLIFIYLSFALFSWLESFFMAVVSQKTVFALRKDFFEKIQNLPISYFDSSKKGDILSRGTNDVDNISSALNQTFVQMIKGALSIAGAIAFMFALNWQLTVVTLFTIPMVLFLVKVISSYTRKFFRNLQGTLGKLNSIVEEDMSGIKVIKAYGREEIRKKKFVEVNEEWKDYSLKAQFFSALMGPGMNFVSNLRFAIVVGFGAWFNIRGIATIGIITSFITYSRQFGRPLSQLAQLYNEIQRALAGAERIFEILDLESEHKSRGKEVKKLKGNIKFENVNFSYDGKRNVLNNINFDVENGKNIALVGPTGAGKTTIINLILRFYDLKSGCILIDGIEMNKIKKTSLRRRIGIVLQDTYLFSGTVIENLRFGNLKAGNKEIEKAAIAANAHEFIMELPEAYDTVLKENGSNLSEGQKQLLAITRAILADYDILILDEATSNVDIRTEKKIQEALDELVKNKTTFVIAHRLSTIKKADEIMLIKNGELIEKGGHKELLSNGGLYRELYMTQFRKSL